MKKYSSLGRSQRAHDRLREKAISSPGLRGDILFAYHSDIIAKQIQREKIVSKAERRKIFERIEKSFKKAKR